MSAATHDDCNEDEQGDEEDGDFPDEFRISIPRRMRTNSGEKECRQKIQTEKATWS